MKTAEEDLKQDIISLLDDVIPNNILFHPLRKKLTWIADRILTMSSRYIDRKISEKK